MIRRIWYALPERRTVEHFFRSLPGRLVEGAIVSFYMLIAWAILAFMGLITPFILPLIIPFWARMEKGLSPAATAALTVPCICVFSGASAVLVTLLRS